MLITSEQRPLRWGILGTGKIAATFVQDLESLPDARAVAVGSRTQQAANEFGDRFGIGRRHASRDALVADPQVDAVYVATPHPAHAAGALAAIRSGKHVLVEKPFTMNAADAAEIAAEARQGGVFCMEAMWTRFLPHMVRIRELLHQGAIGKIITVMADHGQKFDSDPEHRLFSPRLGGGSLLDLGIYPISLASLVLGRPVSIESVSHRTPTGVDSQTSTVLRYRDGAQAVFTTTLECNTPCRAWIAGTEGRIELDPVWYTLSSFTLHRDDEPPVRFEADRTGIAPGGKGMCFEAAEVARCLREGLRESPVMPLDESVEIMLSVDEILKQIGLNYPG
jgi:predicted dehydrogenase